MKTYFFRCYGWFKENSLNLCAIFLCVYLLGFSLWNLGRNTQAVTWGIIGLILLISFVLFYDKLKKIYRLMITSLTQDCSPDQAQVYEKQLLALDKFKGYEKSLVIFNALLQLDTGQFDQLSQLLKDESRFFHSSLDYLAIYNYVKFKMGYLTGNAALLEEYYHKFMEVMHTGKIKNTLFSSDEVNGMYYYACGRYQKSLHYFQQIKTSSMNEREKNYFYFEYAQTLRALNQKHEAKVNEQKITQSAPSFYISHLVNQHEVIKFEKLTSHR